MNAEEATTSAPSEQAGSPRTNVLVEELMRDVQRERLLIFTNGTPDERLAIILLGTFMHSFKTVDIVVGGLCDVRFEEAVEGVLVAVTKHVKLAPPHARVFSGQTRVCSHNGECANTPRADFGRPCNFARLRAEQLHSEINAHKLPYSAVLVLGTADEAWTMRKATGDNRGHAIAFLNSLIVSMEFPPGDVALGDHWQSDARREFTFSPIGVVGEVKLLDRVNDIVAAVYRKFPKLWAIECGTPSRSPCERVHEMGELHACLLGAALHVEPTQYATLGINTYSKGNYVMTHMFGDGDVARQTAALTVLLETIQNSVDGFLPPWHE